MRLGKSGINMSFYYFSGETLQKPRNDERNYEAHLERVKNVKPVVDTHTEVTRLHRRDMTSQKVAYERQALIDRENEILLDKLARIIRRKPEFTNAPRPPHHKSNPLSDRRERQTKEIFKANEKLVQRIHEISQKSSYDKKKLLDDYRKNQMYMQAHSYYPPPKNLSPSKNHG